MSRRLMLRNASGGGGGLPSEYQQVEWIGSSGTQVINTGIIPNVNTVVRATLEKPSVTNANFFGSCGSSYNIKTFLFSYNASGENQRFVCYVGNEVTSEGGSVLFSAVDITDFSITMDFEKIVVTDYNTQTTRTNAYTAYDTNFSGIAPLAIFARNQSGEYRAFSSYKLRSFQIENSGVLQRDFIPCYRKSGGTIGLFDTVSQTFFNNVGSGTFTKGVDVN